MQARPPAPKTIFDWFQFSKGDERHGLRSDFFKSLPQLSDDVFVSLVRADTDPRIGVLRPLSNIREEGRKEVPPLNQLLEELRNQRSRGEINLQYLLWHRGHLLNPRQRMIAREAPCSFGQVRRATVADFLVVDDLRGVPSIVEVKCGAAKDSFTGVILELLAQWCFHKSAMIAFRHQLLADGVQIDESVVQPEAVIVAPVQFYREVLRKSESPERRGEARHAFRLLRTLKSEFGLSVNFIVLTDYWHLQGTRLRCHQLRITAFEDAGG